ncbi:MAG: OsmC family protein [FCB group bacterium]|jgi:putative redox protein
MVQINVEYLGDLHCRVQHGPSGQEFLTDAPTDNQGKGEFISPTDLAAAAIGSCIPTIMGIVANKNNIDIKGLKITVLKEMINEPYRRIGKLSLDMVFPHKLNDHDFQLMKNVIKTCPVTRSLHPDIEIEAVYRFAEDTV